MRRLLAGVTVAAFLSAVVAGCGHKDDVAKRDLSTPGVANNGNGNGVVQKGAPQGGMDPQLNPNYGGPANGGLGSKSGQ